MDTSFCNVIQSNVNTWNSLLEQPGSQQQFYHRFSPFVVIVVV